MVTFRLRADGGAGVEQGQVREPREQKLGRSRGRAGRLPGRRSMQEKALSAAVPAGVDLRARCLCEGRRGWTLGQLQRMTESSL